MNGIVLQFVNDSQLKSVSPVMQFAFQGTELSLVEINQKRIFGTDLVLQSQYYNSRIGRWEPFIELLKLKIDYVMSEFSNPKSWLAVEFDQRHENFNINITRELIKIFSLTLQSVDTFLEDKSSQKQLVDSNSQHSQENQNLENSVKILSPLNKGVSQSDDQEMVASEFESRYPFQNLEQSQILDKSVFSNVSKRSNIQQDDERVLIQKIQWNQEQSDELPIQNWSTSGMGPTEQESEGDSIDYVSPYSISNQTGYPIEVEMQYSKERHLVNAYESMNFNIRNFKSGDRSDQDQYKINLRIVNHQQEKIENIDLQRTQVRLIRFQSLMLKRQLNMVLESRSDDQRKVLVVRGMVSFQNQTNKKIQMYMVNEKERESFDIQIPGGGKEFQLPIDKINHRFSFRFMEDDQKEYKFSNPIDIQKLIERKEEIVFVIPHDTRFQTLLKLSSKKKFQYQVIFQSPFMLRNCLPMEIQVYFKAGDSVLDQENDILKCGEEVYINDTGFTQNLFLKLKIPGFNTTPWNCMYNQNQVSYQQNSIQLIDHSGNDEGQVQILNWRENPYENSSQRRMYIYSPQIAINDCLSEIYYFRELKGHSSDKRQSGYGNLQQWQLVPGQQFQNLRQGSSLGVNRASQILILGQYKSLSLGFEERSCDRNELSQTINMVGIGKDQVRLFRKNPQTQQREIFICGQQTKLQLLESERQIYTKVLHISPYRILVNNMSGELRLFQNSNTSYLTQIKPFSRVPLGIQLDRDPNLFRVQYQNKKGVVYDYLGILDIQAESYCSLVLRNQKQEDDTIFIKMELIQDQHQSFVVFTQTRLEDATYIIENRLENFEIVIYQDRLNELVPQLGVQPIFRARPNEKIQFGWDYQDLRSKGIVILFSDLRNPSQQLAPTQLNLEREYSHKKRQMFMIQGNDMLYHEYQVNSHLNKNTRVLTLSELSLQHVTDQQEEEKIQFQFSMVFKSVGLSLITETFDTNQRVELSYINLSGVDFAIVDNKLVREYQLIIKKLTIDNNLQTSSHFPKAFTYIDSPERKEEYKFFNLIVRQNILAEKQQIFEKVQCKFAPFQVKITDYYLENMIQFFKDSASILNFKKLSNKQGLLLSNSNNLGLTLSQNHPDWEIKPIHNSDKLIVIKKVLISTIKANVSFKKVYSQKSNKQTSSTSKSSPSNPEEFSNKFLDNILKAGDMALSNIDSVNIVLKGLEIDELSHSQSGIISKFKEHYISKIQEQLFSLIGGLNLIGNPAGFLRTVGKGMKDFIEMPKQGFDEGPLEVGKGFIKGAGSLVQNTISGAFTSLHTMSEALGNGVGTLAGDVQYQREREKLKNTEANSTFSGLGQGLVSLYSGIESGLIGAVVKPIEGAQKSGFGGFFKGAAKGLSGLVLKPVTGVIDLASKTAEGIKNDMSEEKENEKKSRIPRVFYRREKILKTYHPGDAYLLNFFQRYKDGKFASINLYYTILLDKDFDKTHIFILSNEVLILFDKTQQKRIWAINTTNIKEQSIQSPDTLRITLFKSDKKIKDSVSVKFAQPQDMQRAFYTILEIRDEINHYQ